MVSEGAAPRTRGHLSVLGSTPRVAPWGSHDSGTRPAIGLWGVFSSTGRVAHISSFGPVWYREGQVFTPT